MIGREATEQIVGQYAKHGWKLRRVLLSERLRKESPDIADAFAGVQAEPAEVDGLWFSRSSRPGITAWELRFLSDTPFALVENVHDGTDDTELERILKRTEIKMIEAVGNKRPGH